MQTFKEITGQFSPRRLKGKLITGQNCCENQDAERNGAAWAGMGASLRIGQENNHNRRRFECIWQGPLLSHVTPAFSQSQGPCFMWAFRHSQEWPQASGMPSPAALFTETAREHAACGLNLAWVHWGLDLFIRGSWNQVIPSWEPRSLCHREASHSCWKQQSWRTNMEYNNEKQYSLYAVTPWIKACLTQNM